MSDALVQVRNLKKYFPVRRGVFQRVVAHVKAVDDVTFSVGAGETLGLVGESGCGKTTVGRTILRLLEPTAGEMIFDGKPVFQLRGRELRSLRREMQIIFQDPYSSLNPRMTVGSIVGEGMAVHRLAYGAERRKKVQDLLDKVGLSPNHVNRYPHEFSGGQRQRIGIARALAVNPRFIVCDEAVSALDVSIQSQILNLLQDLKREFQFSYLFIAHDLSVVEHISDRVAVMYLGEIAEVAPADEIYKKPLHPYTQALLSAIPAPDPTQKSKRVLLPGDVPSPLNPPSGCRFHPRCPVAEEICKQVVPPAVDVGGGHFARCHLVKPDGTAPRISQKLPAAAAAPAPPPAS
ncbi:MAG: dipeptide ABC transporter ATP-binding protein [Planctomycetales bacterium]|nr:dipeptide ABC transporter ATP-binding protein [Planctomycetales bacterium]